VGVEVGLKHDGSGAVIIGMAALLIRGGVGLDGGEGLIPEFDGQVGGCFEGFGPALNFASLVANAAVFVGGEADDDFLCLFVCRDFGNDRRVGLTGNVDEDLQGAGDEAALVAEGEADANITVIDT
jgi:hypothetical protein